LSAEKEMIHNIHMQMICRLYTMSKQILYQKQLRLFYRETFGRNNIFSILFLYPTVIQPYNHGINSRFVFFLHDVSIQEVLPLFEMN